MFNTKYILGHFDYFENYWEAQFQVDGFTGDIEYMTGASPNAMVINNEAGDPFSHTPIKPSYVEFEIVELEPDAYQALCQYDKYCRVVLTKNSAQYWMGWLHASAYRTLYNLCPRVVSLMASDGLGFLKSVPLSDETTEIDGIDYYYLLKYIKQALTTIGLENEFFESMCLYEIHQNPLLSPLEQMNVSTWAFVKDNKISPAPALFQVKKEILPLKPTNIFEKYISLYDVLYYIVQANAARLYQRNGNWYLEHIRQLNEGSITYRVYGPSFTYTGDSEETRDMTITTPHVTPMRVPVNMSLHKEIEPAFSTLNIVEVYNKRDLLFDKTAYTVNKVTVTRNENMLVVSGFGSTGSHSQSVGIRWDLGILKMNSIVGANPYLSVAVGGHIAGRVYIKLGIENFADGKIYFMCPREFGSDEMPDGSTRYAYHWYLFEAMPLVNTLFRLDGSFDFNESIEIMKPVTFHSASNTIQYPEGQLFLLINRPSSGSRLDFDLAMLDIKYNEGEIEDRVHSMTSLIEIQSTRKIESEIHLYTNPPKGSMYDEYNPETVLWDLPLYLVNPQLRFPGLLFYVDDEYRYRPATFVYFAINEESQSTGLPLARVVLTDIMSIYAIPKNRVQGTILGDFHFSDTLTYKFKRYLILSCAHNTYTGMHDVDMLEIGFAATGNYLVTESAEFIEIEGGGDSGEYIILPT